MQTPILDALSKSAALGGFTYAHRPAKEQKVSVERGRGLTERPAPDIPATIEKAHQARGTKPATSLRGPQPTSMTASKDNVVSYRPKGAAR